MAQTYTLDEAAKRLGITPDVLKRRLKEDWKSLRAFRDGSTLRFRTGDVDELARSLGGVSDPSLQLASLDPDAVSLSSSDFKVPTSKKAPPPAEEPLIFELSSSESISFEDPAPSKSKGDSDVRLETPPPRPSRHEPEGTDEIDLDLAGPGSAIIREGSAARLSPHKSSTKLSAADSNNRIDKPNLAESSEFELSLEADSDDFELQINDDSSENDVLIGKLPGGSKKPGESGINLRDPKDSGINLEGKGASAKPGMKLNKPAKPPVQEPSDDDFELSLDPPSSSPSGARSGRLPKISASDSEFELSLDDPSGDDSLMAAAAKDDENNDIFETDFEIPALDEADESASQAKALDDSDSDSDTDQESSDFDLALDSSDIEAEDESASQVVLLEDESDEVEPVPTSARRKPKPQKAVEESDEDDDALSLDPSLSEVEVEDEDDEDAAGALQGIRQRSRYDDDEDEDDEEVERATPVAAAQQWGVLPVLVLAPAFVMMLLGSLIGYEMLHTMWGYHQPRPPGAPIVRGVADMFDMNVKEQ